jgi:hypothetical protein
VLGAAAVLALFLAASWVPATLRGGAVLRVSAAGAAATPSATATPAAVLLPPAPDIGRAALPLPRDIPARAHGPVAAVRNFFFTLSCAAGPAAGASPMGCGETAFPRAYAYLDPGWRARLPYAKFVASFTGVLHTDLLLALDAGPVAGSPNERRVFAEVRRIEQVGDRQVVAFAAGVFTAAAEPTGWLLVGGGLEPEDLAGLAYAGRDVFRADPLAVARKAAGLLPDSPAPATLQAHTGPAAAVRVSLPGGATAVVHLVRRVDGVWQALYVERA